MLRDLGFRDARVTKQGADGGIDVTGRHVAAQVKWHAKPVGRPDLQRLVGAAGTQRQLVFVSREGFSAPAVQYADQLNMALVSLDWWAVARPRNSVAERMLRGRTRT